MKVFVCCNQKGGVGKTTIAMHFGHYLRSRGAKVLLVDFDPQGNMSLVLRRGGECTALQVFEKCPQLKVEAVHNNDPNDFGIMTSDLRLQEAEALTGVGVYTRLQRLLRAEGLPWEYAVVDSPPSLGLFTLNGLVAADQVIIPSEPSLFSITGLRSLMDRIKEVQDEGVNPSIRVAGIVLNEASKTTVSADALEILNSDYGHLRIKAQIPKSVKVEEANQRGVATWEYVPKNPAAVALKAVMDELWERIGANPTNSDQVAA